MILTAVILDGVKSFPSYDGRRPKLRETNQLAPGPIGAGCKDLVSQVALSKIISIGRRGHIQVNVCYFRGL